jgi:branched-chain amino acid transport system permease protein
VSGLLNDIVVPGVAVGAIYALVALGFAVLQRTTGVLNFAHGELIIAGPIVVLAATRLWHLPLAAAMLLAAAAVIGAALVEERLAIRPFLRVHNGLPWIQSTLGTSVILAQLLAEPFGGQSVAYSYGADTEKISLGPVRISPAELVLIAAPVVLALLLGLLYTRTRVGRMLRAVSEDVDGAAAIGISPARMSQLAAALAGVVALVSGLVIAPTELVSPGLGLAYLFNGFVAAALGGLGDLRGALLGGLVVGLVVQIADAYVGSLLINLVMFAVLLLVYLVRPFGVFGVTGARTV